MTTPAADPTLDRLLTARDEAGAALTNPLLADLRQGTIFHDASAASNGVQVFVRFDQPELPLTILVGNLAGADDSPNFMSLEGVTADGSFVRHDAAAGVPATDCELYVVPALPAGSNLLMGPSGTPGIEIEAFFRTIQGRLFRVLSVPFDPTTLGGVLVYFDDDAGVPAGGEFLAVLPGGVDVTIESSRSRAMLVAS
jgi:hypothetical protein